MPAVRLQTDESITNTLYTHQSSKAKTGLKHLDNVDSNPNQGKQREPCLPSHSLGVGWSSPTPIGDPTPHLTNSPGLARQPSEAMAGY